MSSTRQADSAFPRSSVAAVLGKLARLWWRGWVHLVRRAGNGPVVGKW